MLIILFILVLITDAYVNPNKLIVDNYKLVHHILNKDFNYVPIDAREEVKQQAIYGFVKSAHNYFSSRFNEIQSEYKKLLDEYKWTKLVYESEYNFQPIVGHKYYLYQRNNKTLWLSLVNPKNWNHKCLGCFQLLNNGKWKKINL